jgi:hypothetical protein
MKLRTGIFLLALVPAAALAQSSPSPNNTTGPGVDPSVPAPTDMGISSQSGDLRGIPQRGRIGTTGSALSPEPMVVPAQPLVRGPAVPDDLHYRNASPASPAEGIEKER